MKTEYIGSQQHWEDSVNADYDIKLQEKKQYEDSMRDELISQFGSLYPSQEDEQQQFFINNNNHMPPKN